MFFKKRHKGGGKKKAQRFFGINNKTKPKNEYNRLTLEEKAYLLSQLRLNNTKNITLL